MRPSMLGALVAKAPPCRFPMACVGSGTSPTSATSHRGRRADLVGLTLKARQRLRRMLTRTRPSSDRRLLSMVPQRDPRRIGPAVDRRRSRWRHSADMACARRRLLGTLDVRVAADLPDLGRSRCCCVPFVARTSPAGGHRAARADAWRRSASAARSRLQRRSLRSAMPARLDRRQPPPGPRRYSTNGDRRRLRRSTVTVATAASPARAAETARVSPSGRTTLCPRSACQVTSSTTAV